MPFIFLVAYHIFLRTKLKQKTFDKEIFKNARDLLVFLSIPTGLFLAFLLFTSSFGDFYFSAFTFNNEFYYQRIYEQRLNPQIVDFYLNTSRDVFKHFYELVIREGSVLFAFLKSAKFIIWPPAVEGSYFSYLSTIFSNLYNDFFTFEIFIALFYLWGILALLLKRKFSLAIFLILFIFAIRLRLLQRIFYAPYYLTAYWLFSLSIATYLYFLFKRKKVFLSGFMLFISFLILGLFVSKNWSDFEQIAFNTFSRPNKPVVDFLAANSEGPEKITTIGLDSSYYYDSQSFPGGSFINYFEWYDLSEKLRNKRLREVRSNNEGYVFVGFQFWEKYCHEEKGWFEPSMDVLRHEFKFKNIPNHLAFVKIAGQDLVDNCNPITGKPSVIPNKAFDF